MSEAQSTADTTGSAEHQNGGAAGADDRSLCTPCRGGGTLISGKGGTPHPITCPWCGGDGQFHPGRDAQQYAPRDAGHDG